MSVRGPRLVVPSGLVLVVAAMLVPLTTATNRSSGVARLVVVGVIAAVVADGWLARRSLRHLAVEVATPTLATSGRPFDARAVVTGVTRPATIDGLFGDGAEQPIETGVPFSLACRPGQRGVFDHLLVEVRARSPLGLWTAARRVAVRLPVPLLVGPRPRPLDQAPPDPPAGGPGDATAADQRGTTVTRSVREYRPGDPARQVHWATSAHQGRLMVRETDGEARPLPVVVVTAHRAGAAAEATFGRAATAVAELIESNGAVRLVTTERAGRPEPAIPWRVLLPGSRPRGALVEPGAVVTVDAVVDDPDRARARLARAEPGRPEPAPPTAPAAPAAPGAPEPPSGPPVWWITDDEDQP